MALRFVPLEASHVPAIMEIERASQGAPWSELSFLKELENPHSIFRVAFDGKELVGYGGVWTIVDEAHITTITIAPGHRGKGWGKALMIALLDAALDAGMTCATLEVRAGNAPALGLYDRLGFQRVAVRKRYYPDNQEDAVVMWLYQLKDLRR